MMFYISLSRTKNCEKLQITSNKMQRFLNLFIFTDAVNVSGCSCAQQQEHITVRTASGIVN